MSWNDRFSGRDVGVLGLARSGLAAVRALLPVAGRVLVFDDRDEAVAEAVALGAAAGAPADVTGLAALVVSPGIPLTHPSPHPIIQRARGTDVPLLSDLDLLAARLGERRVVGVTGTNGKSTTTALIHHLLVSAGIPAVIGGNIGVPVLDLDLGGDDTVLVLELSSFQLDLMRQLPVDVAVWTNFTPDHLDRHGDLAGYLAAKERIFDHGRAHATAVIGVNDPASRELLSRLQARGTRRLVPISGDSMPGTGVGVVDGRLLDASDYSSRFVADLADAPALRGAHNHQNAAAAYAACRALGVVPAVLAKGLATFQGLPHRMERVLDKGGVLWINDSKATNPDAAAKSLGSFERIIWIAGGKAKPGGFGSLAGALGAVERAYLIGDAAAELERDLGNLVPCEDVGTLERAVAAARGLAEAGTTVLLAPACASFDQFKDYEQRGTVFRELVLGGGSKA